MFMLKAAVFSFVGVMALAVAAVQADPSDDIKSAVKALADSPNYSWSTTVQGGFGRGPQEGKTEKDGYTSVSIQIQDNPYDIIIKGDKAAIKTDSGWKTPAELMADAGDAADGPPPPEQFAAIFARNFKTPTEQAQDTLDNLQNIQKTDTGYTADLTEDAAKKMLNRNRPRRNAATTNPDNGNGPPPFEVSNPKGSVKLTIKDGTLTQVQFHLTATISFNGNDRDVDRTTTMDIKNVGSTTVDVPDEAKAKLSS
jgi:hypothetical protein